jgi:cyclomaltodextrinase
MKGLSTHHCRSSTETSPPWWRDAIIYHILVDRFRRGGKSPLTGHPTRPEFCGGNLQGVTESLSYLRRLGVNTLWLSPINSTAAYHGYHVTDFEKVERRFGGMTAFRKLLRAAKPDFRILLDWVPNHVHRTHPLFLDAQRSPRSRYRDWFYFNRRGGYRCFLDFTELPKLNLEHPDARRYIIECALMWLDLGADGFRLDHVLGPSLDFWREFRSAIKKRHPAAFLMGEALFTGIGPSHLVTVELPHKRRHLQKAQGGHPVAEDVMFEYVDVFDGILDFEFQRLIGRYVAHQGRLPSTRAIEHRLDRHYRRFPEKVSLPSFLDNHDMNRFLFEARNNKARLKKAAEIQFHQNQPPIIYYGTEAGMSQLRPLHGPHGDLVARQMMPWPNPDRDLFEHYQQLIEARKRRLKANARKAAKE